MGYKSYIGEAEINKNNISYISGTTITEFPKHNYLFFANLRSEYDVLYNYKAFFPTLSEKKAIFGLYNKSQISDNNGKISIFGDSTCLEIQSNSCLFLIDMILDFIQNKEIDI